MPFRHKVTIYIRSEKFPKCHRNISKSTTRKQSKKAKKHGECTLSLTVTCPHATFDSSTSAQDKLISARFNDSSVINAHFPDSCPY